MGAGFRRPSFTPHTVQLNAEEFRAPLWRQHPFAVLPRRIVTHMLGVAALQIRNPVSFPITVKSDNAPGRHDPASYAVTIANIGPRERRLRVMVGWISFAAAAAIAVLLLAIGAPRAWRLLLFAPLWLGALGIFQARANTCVYLARRCVRNMDAGETPIVDALELEAVARQARGVSRRALLTATLLTIIALALPL